MNRKDRRKLKRSAADLARRYVAGGMISVGDHGGAVRVENKIAKDILEAALRASLVAACIPTIRRLTETEAAVFPFLNGSQGTPWLAVAFDCEGRAAFVTRRLPTRSTATATAVLAMELRHLCSQPGIPMPSAMAGHA